MNNKQYYVTLPDKAQEGPYDEETLIARYQAGKYLEGTLVWSDGMDGWIHIETIMSNAEKITNDVMRSADCKPNMPPLSVSIPPTPPTPSIPYNFKKEYYVEITDRPLSWKKDIDLLTEYDNVRKKFLRRCGK